ncbi:hypothetical protein P692DRAFT_20710357, partial [Suillus brevipes Sb2]
GFSMTDNVFSPSQDLQGPGSHTQTHFHRFQVAILIPLDLQLASPYPAADFHTNSISLSPPSTAFPP